jgi:hypothetical protein
MQSAATHAHTTFTDRVRLLARAIEQSGLTQRDFAIAVLVRDPRTVRRWLTGDRPMPTLVVHYLEGLAACEGGVRGAIRRGVRITIRSARV